MNGTRCACSVRHDYLTVREAEIRKAESLNFVNNSEHTTPVTTCTCTWQVLFLNNSKMKSETTCMLTTQSEIIQVY